MLNVKNEVLLCSDIQLNLVTLNLIKHKVRIWSFHSKCYC